MSTCFVIQPFDKGRFDKRYEDAFKPALAEAGFNAYRVDEDPGVDDVLIDAIEKGITRAPLCLADVTTDNPNVWYELGFAYAAGKPVILTCCDEREGALPFDIRHRKVIQYKSESTSDFEDLKRQVTARAKALQSGAIQAQSRKSDPVAPRDGLSQMEIQLLGIVAAATAVPDARESVWIVQQNARSIGLTDVAIGLAIRGLRRQRLIVVEEVDDPGGTYDGAYVTDSGWDWIQEHSSFFNLTARSPQDLDDLDSEVPF